MRVLDIDGAGTDFDVAQGSVRGGTSADDGNTGTTVQATSGAKVINLSLGGPTTSKVIHKRSSRDGRRRAHCRGRGK